MKKPIALAIKWVLIAVALLGILYIATKLAAAGNVMAVVLAGLVGMGVLAVYATKRSVPLKYLVPGLLFMILFQLWPVLYTASLSVTNYGDGHLYSKEESVTDIIAQSVREVPDTPRYKMSVAIAEGGDPATADLVLLLTKPDGSTYVGDNAGLKPLPPTGVEKTPVGKITKAPGYTILTAKQANARSKDLSAIAVPTSDGGGIKPVGLSEAFEGKATVTYDSAADQLTDAATAPPSVYAPKDAKWVNVADPTQSFPQGWKENIGLANYSRIFTDSTIRSGFISIFIWNIAFAILSVLTTFLLGMLIALLFNDPRLRGKAFYRSLLILPYALPGFVTALVWKGMFNQDYGIINQTLGISVDWLGTPGGAKAAILITNLWLGFPYMFIVCTGALQSIPQDVREAATIDGANAFRTLRSIIMPLLFVAVGPLLLASFAFNFNNFGLIYLLTKGGPFNGADTSIGSSDLLITYAFRLAFSGSAPNYGFAAAVSVIIFLLVALMSIPGFRRTKALEEVN
ncbi:MULTISPECIES: ABC transporter permease subunit [unclassified Terrabacter]|uniref:ABC transporter permease subunit n=1 Tax=unclassified Terrabacter TaxID=2630222 RepID=UPI0006FF6427|nr:MULTISPECIES: ABC transporter permease subunit [unclassified Terrabacter]KRB47648.1 sugar ABC transporter permease [Terrabacter sp. Root181]KRF40166.1 sugar ABC transporter permease [Terrabacter sp. Soil810]